jgi:DNA-binding transcriptional ArsR family regulator
MVVDTLSSAFAALSDPTRRVILDRLMRGPATVNELAKPHKMTQQAVSKHVAYLERARLVTKKRRGREHLCSLRPSAIRHVADWANAYRCYWEEGLERLDHLLREDGEKASRRGRTK